MIFLAGSSARHEWHLDQQHWGFNSQILDRRPSGSGYYRPNLRIGPVGRVLRDGRNTALVLLYADLTCVLAATICRLIGIPYHLAVDNTVDDSRSGSRFNELMKRVLFAGARSCLATGPLQAEYARRYARRRTPVAVIGSPVDTVTIRQRIERRLEDRESLRRERGWADRFVVAYIGRLSHEKNLPLLAEAADRVAGNGVPLTLALAGSGPLEGEMRRLGGESRAHLDMLGFVEGERLAQVYAASDVVVLVSESESWGLVVNEAMEYALPLVVSDRVGARHLIESGTNGFIVPTGDADALAAVLLSLANNPSLRTRMGAAARLAVVDQTVDQWVEHVVRHLEATT